MNSKNFFCIKKKDLVFCNDVCSVTEALGHRHVPTEEWRLFTDSSKVDLNLCFFIKKGKGKVIPLQARRGPEGG